jgi:hypothetical protein
MAKTKKPAPKGFVPFGKGGKKAPEKKKPTKKGR